MQTCKNSYDKREIKKKNYYIPYACSYSRNASTENNENVLRLFLVRKA